MSEVDTFVLQELRSGFADMNSRVDKLSSQISDANIASAAVQTKLPRIESDVDKLIKTVHLGNGSPSIVLQLAEIKAAVDDVDDRLTEARTKMDQLISTVAELSRVLDSKESKLAISDRDLKRARWVAYGKVAAAIGLSVPGIVAFLSNIL